MSVYDAVVVGAGPAGSLAARELARRGASVMLVERASFPRFKVCGGCLGAGTVAMLESVGLLERVLDAGARPVTALRLRGRGRLSCIPLPGGLGLSRRRLDEELLRAAADAGVDVQLSTRATLDELGARGVVVQLDHDGLRRAVSAKVVIDATGLGAGLAADGLAREERAAPHARVGLGLTVTGGDDWLEPGSVRMLIGSAGYVGCVRLEDRLYGFAAAIDREALSSLGPEGIIRAIAREAGDADIPRVLEAATTGGGGRPPPRWRGTPVLTRRPLVRAGVRLFRIGDAAGYVEPFTGEGMGWAMASALAVVPYAEAAASAWSNGLVEQWEREYRRRVGRRQLLCHALACALRRPSLAAPVMAVLSRRPNLVRPLVRTASGLGRA